LVINFPPLKEPPAPSYMLGGLRFNVPLEFSNFPSGDEAKTGIYFFFIGFCGARYWLEEEDRVMDFAAGIAESELLRGMLRYYSPRYDTGELMC
jgi:hypothetical protein